MIKTEKKEVLAKKLVQLSGVGFSPELLLKEYMKILKPDLIRLVQWAEDGNKDGDFVRNKAFEIIKAKGTGKEIDLDSEVKQPFSFTLFLGRAVGVVVLIFIALFVVAMVSKCANKEEKRYYERGVPYGNSAVKEVKKALEIEGYR